MDALRILKTKVMNSIADGIISGFVSDLSGINAQLEVCNALSALLPVIIEIGILPSVAEMARSNTSDFFEWFANRANGELASIHSLYFFVYDGEDMGLVLAVREIS